MTTQVTIGMTSPHNDKDIVVDVLGEEGNLIESLRVTDGNPTKFYVHNSQSLAVREVDKESEEDASENEDKGGPDVTDLVLGEECTTDDGQVGTATEVGDALVCVANKQE